MPTIEDAIKLSLCIHRGQIDKAGKPYILHPLRVMIQMSDEETQIVAVLHDAFEDGPMTLTDLKKQGYSESVQSALKCLTRRREESYDAYIDRVKTNPMSVLVKMADLRDNLNLGRIEDPTSKDYDRHEKYKKTLANLEKALLCSH